MKIPATLELRGQRWTQVVDPSAVDITGIYVLVIAGGQDAHLYIDDRYIGLIIGSTPTIEFEYEFGSGIRDFLVTERTLHMMLHTHAEDDPRHAP